MYTLTANVAILLCSAHLWEGTSAFGLGRIGETCASMLVPARQVGTQQSEGVGRLKCGHDVTVLNVRPADYVLQVGSEDPDHLPVHVVDVVVKNSRAQISQRSRPPAACVSVLGPGDAGEVTMRETFVLWSIKSSSWYAGE